jgi:hypothetical protein
MFSMSSIAKGFGGCLGVFAAICCVCVGGCVFMAFVASKVKIDQPKNAAVQPAAVAAPQAQPKPPENPKWTLTTSKDDLTDKEFQVSTLQSTNTVNLKFPYSGEQRGTLTVRFQGERPSVVFSIARGQLFPMTLQLGNGKATVRVDDVTIESPISPATGMQTEVMFLTDERLPDLIMKGRELRIEVELFQESNQVFVFDLTSGR